MSAEEVNLDLLKKQRAAFKGQLTYFKGQCVSASTLGTYESLLRRIQIVYDKYSSVQSKIESVDDTTNDRDSFEDEYGKLEALILNRIHELKKAEDTNASATFQNESIHEASPTNNNSMGIRLPELKLPSFSGADSDWLAFRDVFLDLIHNKKIDSTVKFVYLISHIRSGTAYSLIENLPVTAENYEVAWKSICDRYNNELSIQKIHMREIYEVKIPQENSAKSLQAFIDHVVKNYNALKSLKVKIDEWDLMLTHHLTQRLDSASRTEVIRNSKTNKVLSFVDLIQILRNRVQLVQALQSNSTQQASKQYRDTRKFTSNSNRSSTFVVNPNKCSFCSGSHLITHCSSFTNEKLTPQMRFRFIKNNQLCTNCLIDRHNVRDCMQPPCKMCSLKHNVILHFRNYQVNKKQSPTTSSNVNASSIDTTSSLVKHLSSKVEHDNTLKLNNSGTSQSSHISASSIEPAKSKSSTVNGSKGIVMLGTALVNATAINGNQVICRALLDSGSHMNFITSEACNRLNAKRHPTFKTISGIGGKESHIKHKIYLTITSRVSTYRINLKFYVLSKITNDLPSSLFNFELPSLTIEIELADPFFNVPDRIDLLLGIEIYNQLFKGDFVQPFKDLPPFYNTELGYVVCGKAKTASVNRQIQHSYVALCNMQTLESQLKQFWELETISVKNTYSSEGKLCEEHYCKNVKRLPCGRYSVALPVKPNIDELGTSAQSALRQFIALEKRLHSKANIYEQYREFISEYMLLGHMVPAPYISDTKSYYLPHHYVLKESSTTTKLRVVFNASAKTSSQLSLNDCLMVGPTIQQTLFAIILRFRKHVYAFCGDIAKMYRQILVHGEQQDLQRIWWRNHSSEDIQSFKLCTVTYGTASAPFLATRTLNQLAIDKVVAEDFYVDDVLTGTSTLSDAIKLKSDLTNLLNLGGFELRKFRSNHPSLTSEDQSDSAISLILGILWDTESDTFQMSFDHFSVSTHCSKRTILSEICQHFDPLGLCAPIVVTAKLVMQTLWTLQEIGWDDRIPQNIADQWVNFKSELINLKKLTVPRCVLTPHIKGVELHGFGDASEKAFGCVIYLRVTDSTGCHHVSLLCAKSRVAPLKKQSIPRLELCAALLLAETSHTILQILNLSMDAIFLWSDSEITLYRIKSEPNKYSTFVANRIAKIQEYTSSTSWQYVHTSLNPADHVSRGIMPSEFLHASLWWSGPNYLSQDKNKWPKSSNSQLSLDLMNLDIRQTVTAAVSEANNCEIFTRYHSLTILLRVVAYMFRFYNRTKFRISTHPSIELSPIEVDQALTCLIKLVQQHDYKDEIKQLQTNKAIFEKSSLRFLAPFLDDNGILRVGGRLQNSSLSYGQKHQILLPGTHLFSKLLVEHEHWRLLHAGPQALLYNLRLKYWIVGGRNLCRTVVNKCIRCFYARPHIRNQIMGNLPTDRVTKSLRPFVIVGIDFCEPFYAKPTIRSKLINKIYVCLFICFSTKAVHLEIVMNLSTESFIACLRRFVARRGMCSKIYSDNATNFVGARSELREFKDLFLSQHTRNETIRYCTSHNIEWLTIPPRSPHFGGLWESAIKSAKYHMNRVIGNSSFTFEEFHTLIAQVEACLNSRPLTALSSDPSNFNVLSPGHFIIGSPLTSLVEPALLDLKTNKLSRFQALQKTFQIFWKRWQLEYLTELQRRYKWQKGQYKFQIGSLVLIHDDNLPPMKWRLGRITETHPGKDGVVRVVTIQTHQSTLKRAVNRISMLPIDDESN